MQDNHQGQDGAVPHPRVLLVDVDNCPRQMERLMVSLAGFSRVVLCHGSVEPRVPLGMVPVLAGALGEGRLEVVGMRRSGKNAADFGLAFVAGRLLAEMPAETEFVVLSQDGDLDHVVDLLEAAHRKAERLSGGALGPPLTDAADATSALRRIVERFVTISLQEGDPRPRTRKALLRSIAAHLGSSQRGVEPEEVLRHLVGRGVLTISSNGRIDYLAPETEGYGFEEPDDIPF